MSFFRSKIFKFGLPTILILIGIAYFSLQSYLSHQPSVLYKYKDKAAVDPVDELYVIFNPFRDKSPETAAENFLNALKNGDCQKVKASTTVDCEHEDNKTIYALRFWKLIDREENADEIRLHFEVDRAGYENNYGGNVWVTVKKEDTIWQVTGYESWY